MSSSRPSEEVLIVGAGPSGLALGIGLRRLGIAVRIVEKGAARSIQSKAIGIQAGTLECLDAFVGPELSARLVAAGKKARGAYLHIGEREPVHASLGRIPSQYDFLLVLPQSETERFFEAELERLGGRVERRTECVAIDAGSGRARVRAPDGTEDEREYFYIAGCDGAHSVVRHQIGAPFEGGTYEGEFILGDVALEWPWEKESIHVFFSDRGVIAGFPMVGGYRLILIPKPAVKSTSPEIELEEFSRIVDRLSFGRIQVKSSNWLTRFRLHHRIVSHYRQGRAFLVGDAAHIHSPVGAQGMNTGIQDALNLASKLAQVIHGKAGPELLEDYERERLPVARAVVRTTDFAFQRLLMPDSGPGPWFRANVLPRLIRVPFILDRAARAVSQVDIARRDIARYELS